MLLADRNRFMPRRCPSPDGVNRLWKETPPRSGAFVSGMFPTVYGAVCPGGAGSRARPSATRVGKTSLPHPAGISQAVDSVSDRRTFPEPSPPVVWEPTLDRDSTWVTGGGALSSSRPEENGRETGGTHGPVVGGAPRAPSALQTPPDSRACDTQAGPGAVVTSGKPWV